MRRLKCRLLGHVRGRSFWMDAAGSEVLRDYLGSGRWNIVRWRRLLWCERCEGTYREE